jgi:hypothetical protein
MRRFAPAFSLVLLFLAPAARADPSSDALVRDGIVRFEAGDYQAARADFARAYAAAPRAATLLDLALAELAAHAPLDALRHFRAYLVDPGASPDAAARVRERMLPRAMAETGHLEVSLANGATLAIDGEPTPQAGTIDVAAGRHVVEARLAGRTVRFEVVAPAGQRLRVDVGAPAPSSGSPRSPGAGTSAARPGASRSAPSAAQSARPTT